MGAEFGSLSAALSSLMSHQRAIEVTGQNLANANTEGYTRQRAVFEAVGGSVLPAMFSTSDGIGSGVRISGVQRLQDAFLESRSNTESGTLAYLQGTSRTLNDIEQMFGEPGDNGIQHLLSNFWNSWDDIANDPSPNGEAARTQLLGAANSLAAGFNQVAGSMAAQWTSIHEQLEAQVAAVNTAAASVAQLNQAIVAAAKAGNSPNDLMDQRDMLVRQLTSTLGATTRAGGDGAVDVFLGGDALVRGNIADTLVVGGANALDQVPDPATNPPPSVTISWDGGGPASIRSGQIGAQLESLNSTLPSYRYQLDDVANSLVTAVNTQHAAGYDLNGDAGGAFFDPAGTTAASIAVALTDGAKVAASSVAPTVDGGGNTVVSYDGGNAQAMAALAGTGADLAYRKFIVRLGSDTQAAGRRVDMQQSIVTQIDASRDSQAGVSIDEELTNLIAYQQAYGAAARYLSTVDRMLDTLINHTGVG